MKMRSVFAILILIALGLYLLESRREHGQKQGNIWNRYLVFYPKIRIIVTRYP